MSAQSFWDKILAEVEIDSNQRRKLKLEKKIHTKIPAWDVWKDEIDKWYPYHIKEHPPNKELHILNCTLEKITRESNKTGEEFLRWAIRNWETLGYKQPIPRIKEFVLSYKEKLAIYMSGKHLDRVDEAEPETRGKISRVIRPKR